jgi:hypothetical protein
MMCVHKYSVPVRYEESVVPEIAKTCFNYQWITDAVPFQVPFARSIHATTIEVWRVGAFLSTPAILDVAEGLRKRPIIDAELRCLQLSQPDCADKYPIIALGTFFRDPHRFVRSPFISKDGSTRYIWLGYCHLVWWPEDCVGLVDL